jgi:hypothetical protein
MSFPSFDGISPSEKDPSQEQTRYSKSSQAWPKGRFQEPIDLPKNIGVSSKFFLDQWNGPQWNMKKAAGQIMERKTSD